MRRLLAFLFAALSFLLVPAENATIFRMQDETQLLHLPVIDDNYFANDNRTIELLMPKIASSSSTSADYIRLCYLLKKKGQHSLAADFAVKGVKADLADITMLNIAAAILLHSHQFDQLNELCQMAVAKNPKNADAYNIMGIVAQERGYTGTAIYDFEKALELNKKYKWINFNLANSYRSAGRYDEAVELYKKSSKKFLADQNFVASKNFKFKTPNLLWINNNIGLTYTMKGDYDSAMAAFKEALTSNNNSAKAFNGMACTYYEMGVRDSSVALLERAITAQPRFSSPYKNLGNIYYEKGNFSKAIEYYTRAYNLDNTDEWLLCKIGCTYKNMREYEKALRFFDEAISIEANDAEAYYEKGLCYYRLSDTEKANSAFNTALKLGCEKARGWIR